MSDHLQLGRFGEDAAAHWYRAHGYHILDRNWSCASGELDLVVRSSTPDVSVVVFVEVKTRRTNRFGTGLDAVTWDKQRRIRRLAGQWIGAARTAPESDGDRTLPSMVGGPSAFEIRFDVVDVDGRGHVHVVEGAF